MIKSYRVKSVFVAAILILGLTGCSVSGKSLQFVNGLKANEVFKMEDAICTLPQAMIFITTERNKYEQAYTNKIWQVPIHEDGSTYEDYLLNSVREFLSEIKCMNLMADSYKIELSEDENLKIKEASDAYYNSLTTEDISFMGITIEDVVESYSEYRVANKLVAEVTKDVDTEVSDNEAKVITIQQIWVKDRDTAQLVHGKVMEEGADFTAIASEYTEDEKIEFQFGKGEMNKVIELAAFALTTGQVSDIIETENGYHILKSISDYDIDATQTNKGKIVIVRRSEVFDKVYDEFKGKVDAKYNDKLWDSIMFSPDSNATTINFYAIYNEYFPE